MNEVKMAKVIMELGEFGEFFEEYQRRGWETEDARRECDKLRKENSDLKKKLEEGTEFFLFHGNVLFEEGFGTYEEAKKKAVERAENTGFWYKIVKVVETVTKGEKF